MKKPRAFIPSILCIFALLFVSVPLASGHGPGEKKEKKVGILLVAFGSSEQSAQVSFENIEKHAQAAYEGIPIRWAYTSHIIRHKLARQGKHLDSPEVALGKMKEEGFTHVAVQSLHTIGGAEYHDLRRVVGGFKSMGAFERIVLGYPLLATQEDMQRVVKALMDILPEERKPGDAVLLMGHGTHHPSNAFYAALMYQLQLVDPNIYVGTVEGFPGIDLMKEQLQEKGVKKVYLMPFMSVAGDHAKNDMAGEEDDSWISILSKAGFECVPILKGMAEYDVFADMWVGHIQGPLAHF